MLHPGGYDIAVRPHQRWQQLLHRIRLQSVAADDAMLVYDLFVQAKDHFQWTRRNADKEPQDQDNRQLIIKPLQ